MTVLRDLAKKLAQDLSDCELTPKYCDECVETVDKVETVLLEVQGITKAESKLEGANEAFEKVIDYFEGSWEDYSDKYIVRVVQDMKSQLRDKGDQNAQKSDSSV